MIVKTYPTPSSTYGELTCTAGIRLRDNTWIRIYPYPFRTAQEDYQFEKYQIIQAPLLRASNDPRPDSYKLRSLEDVEIVDKIPTGDEFWTPRMGIIRRTVISNVAALETQMVVKTQKIEGEVLLDGGSEKKTRYKYHWNRMILPVPVQSDFAQVEAKYVGEDWSDEDRVKLCQVTEVAQAGLFQKEFPNRPVKLLRFPHYRFYLNFRDLTGQEYRKLILDWEITRLYFRMLQQYGSRIDAIQKVKEKIEGQIFGPRNEVFLVLGNIHHRYGKPMLAVDGFIYPKKQKQGSLFQD